MLYHSQKTIKQPTYPASLRAFLVTTELHASRPHHICYATLQCKYWHNINII